MDHFALPEDRLSQALNDETLNRNFMGYTTHRGARIVGIGASSISSLPTGYAQNEKDVTKYLDICQDNKLPIIRGVLRNQDDCLRAEIIEQILCSGILDIKSIEENWQIDFWQYFDNAKAPLESMAEDGLIELQQSEFRLSKVGRVLARNVAMVFDAYLPKYRERKQKTFSQTV
jgi:oxygen-independent coproporphyrinogen-3 oxidase